jgi:hypothetical protein
MCSQVELVDEHGAGAERGGVAAHPLPEWYHPLQWCQARAKSRPGLLAKLTEISVRFPIEVGNSTEKSRSSSSCYGNCMLICKKNRKYVGKPIIGQCMGQICPQIC